MIGIPWWVPGCTNARLPNPSPPSLDPPSSIVYWVTCSHRLSDLMLLMLASLWYQSWSAVKLLRSWMTSMACWKRCLRCSWQMGQSLASHRWACAHGGGQGAHADLGAPDGCWVANEICQCGQQVPPEVHGLPGDCSSCRLQHEAWGCRDPAELLRHSLGRRSMSTGRTSSTWGPHIPYHTIYMETIPYTCSNTWKPMCVWSNHGGIGFQHLVKHTVCGLIVVAHVPSPFQNLASLKHDACSVFQLLAPCCQCIECAAECWKQGFACPNKGITFASTWKVFAHMPKTGTCPFAKYWKPYIHNIPLYVYIYIYILYYI